MESAWKLKIPLNRDQTAFLNFELKEIGIDEFMAVQSFLQKNKAKEAIILFLNATRTGGDEVQLLKEEFDKNNSVPFMAAMRYIPDILEPVPGELKKK